MKVIDLRSDTLTLPPREMLEHMLTLPLGDDGRVKGGKGEDPTAAEAERRVAALFGREDALFIPSGSMGNMACIMAHCKRGDRVVTAHNMHLYKAEQGIFSEALCGFVPVCLPHSKGVYDLTALENTLKQGNIALVCMENTYNAEGGKVISRADMEAVLTLCRRYRVPVHLDGARIFNAAAALGTDAAALTAGFDSVQFCVSKGLSAPIGSFLVGSRTFVAKAREARKLLGGQLRQVGLLAGAGWYAIAHLSARLIEDHKHARRLAEGLCRAKGISIDLSTVESNMVRLTLPRPNSTEWAAALACGAGVLAQPSGDDGVRFVTYRGITDEDIEEAIVRICRFCKEQG